MDTVTIAFFETNHFLVQGERYLDRVLEGREPLACEVTFVTCQTWAQVIELWERPDGDMPWAIHPRIVQRLKEELTGMDDDEGWALNLK